jgi:hypothetical protein
MGFVGLCNFGKIFKKISPMKYHPIDRNLYVKNREIYRPNETQQRRRFQF